MNYLNSLLIESGERAGAGIKKHNTASIKIWVLLSLMRIPPIRSFLLQERGL